MAILQQEPYSLFHYPSIPAGDLGVSETNDWEKLEETPEAGSASFGLCTINLPELYYTAQWQIDLGATVVSYEKTW